MNVDRQAHFHLVDAIREERVSAENLDSLNRIIAENGSAQLVDALICSEKAAGKNEDDAVSETMRHLESLADITPSLACLLMVHLLPISSRLLLDDIFNGIELWIHHHPSHELARQLKLLAAAETNPGGRTSYSDFAEFIESTLKSPRK